MLGSLAPRGGVAVRRATVGQFQVGLGTQVEAAGSDFAIKAWRMCSGPGGSELRKKKKKVVRKGRRERRSNFLRPLVLPSQTQVATKRQKVVSEFAHLSQFLEEQQSILLAQLERLDGEILKQQDEFDVVVAGEICRFSALIAELEEKSKRQPRELLTVSRPRLRCPASSPCLSLTPSVTRPCIPSERWVTG